MFAAGPHSGKGGGGDGGGDRSARGRGRRKHRHHKPQPFAGVDRGLPPGAASDTVHLSIFGIAADLEENPEAAAAEDSGLNLVPWMGDVSNAMDRFDVRLLLEEMPQPGQPPRAAAARAAWEAAATITEAEPVDEETLDLERYRSLGESDDSDDSEEEGPAVSVGSGFQAVPFSYGDSSAAAAQGREAGSGYQTVGFSYGGSEASTADGGGARHEESGDREVGPARSGVEAAAVPTVALESFVPRYQVPAQLEGNLPDTERMHKIIAQTARFVREAGGQSEFVLSVRQAGNPNFRFLVPADRLHPYYRWLLREAPQEQELCAQEAPQEKHPAGPVDLLGSLAAYASSDMDSEVGSSPRSSGSADGPPFPSAAAQSMEHDKGVPAFNAAAPGTTAAAEEDSVAGAGKPDPLMLSPVRDAGASVKDTTGAAVAAGGGCSLEPLPSGMGNQAAEEQLAGERGQVAAEGGEGSLDALVGGEDAAVRGAVLEESGTRIPPPDSEEPVEYGPMLPPPVVMPPPAVNSHTIGVPAGLLPPPEQPAPACVSAAAAPALTARPSLAPGPSSTPEIVAIMDKLIQFIQKNGVEFAAMVRQHEKDNPRFGFLLPWNALHSLYRERAAAVLSAPLAAELFDSCRSAATPAAVPATHPPSATTTPSVPAAGTTAGIGPAPVGGLGADAAVEELVGQQPATARAEQEADLEALSSTAAESSGAAESSSEGFLDEAPAAESGSARAATAAGVPLKLPVRGLVANPSLAPAGVRKRRLWDVTASDAATDAGTDAADLSSAPGPAEESEEEKKAARRRRVLEVMSAKRREAKERAAAEAVVAKVAAEAQAEAARTSALQDSARRRQAFLSTDDDELLVADVRSKPKHVRQLRRKATEPPLRQLSAAQLSGSVGHALTQMRQAFAADEDGEGDVPAAETSLHDSVTQRLRAAEEAAMDVPLSHSDAESGELLASPPRAEGGTGLEGVAPEDEVDEFKRVEQLPVIQGVAHPDSGAEDVLDQRSKRSKGEKHRKERSHRSPSQGKEPAESRRQNRERVREREKGQKHKKRRQRSDSRSVSPLYRRRDRKSSRSRETSKGLDSEKYGSSRSRPLADACLGSRAPVAGPLVSDALRARVRAMLESVATK